jgi:hypothetical protein
MATATAAIVEQAPAIIKSGLPSTILTDSEATVLVAAYQSLRKHGLEFGRLCYNFRKRSKVVSGGTTFDSTLDKLDIPRSSAYRWIARYEESIGVRPAPKVEKKPVQSALPEPAVSLGRVEPSQKTIQVCQERGLTLGACGHALRFRYSSHAGPRTLVRTIVLAIVTLI